VNSTFFHSRRIQYFMGIIGAYFSLFIIFRIIFYFSFIDISDAFQFSEIMKALFIGLRFDLRLAIISALPIILLSSIPFINSVKSHFIRKLTLLYWLLSIMVLLFFYIADFGHYSYLDRRLEISAVSFLENPVISLNMIWESYPVFWVVVLFLFIFAGLTFVKKIITQKTLIIPSRVIPTKQKVLGIVFCSLFFLFGCWGSFSQYALRWSNAFFSRNPFISAMALNPVLYFYDTMQFSEKDYDLDYIKSHYDLIAEYLKVDNPDQSLLNFDRTVEPASENIKRKQPNVVIIFLESVSANRLGILGNPLNPAPNLDRLTEEGLFFSRFYVPNVGTARSVFTLITGIPDVAKFKTSSRNPLVSDQYTIITEFKNYKKHYIIGGSASWANIRGLITYNIKDLHLTELGDFDRPRIDVWGISDLDLLREAHEIFLKESKDRPFFAIVQTATNHRPYTIPDNNTGFEILDIPEDQIKNAGFRSLAQYNAMRFLDHSIGEFFRLASESSYFENTVFVLFGDHGTSDPRAHHMQPSDYDLKLRSYHVPFIIYDPSNIGSAQTIETVCSLPDLMPTLTAYLGIPFTNQTLGTNRLNNEPDDERVALIINKKYSPKSYGAIGQKYYLQIFDNGSWDSLHDLWSDNPIEDVKNLKPLIYEKFKQKTNLLYETSKYMLYHNQQDQ